MSIDIFAFVGCALIACALIVLLKQYKPEMALFVSVAAAVLLSLAAIGMFTSVFDDMSALIDKSGVSNESISLLLKVFGVCVLTQIAADICRDSNQSALAGRIETGGRLAALVISLPLYFSVLELSLDIIG